ncbi:MAG: DUF4097 family beta strand repeat-containing protein [Candidatus Cybelea sp.]
MSRASVVAMLVAAEILIVGMAVAAVGRGHASIAGGLHHLDFSAVPVAPIAAGAAPHVVVDDVDSRVGVTPSSDDQVHVRDLTEIRGAVFSSTKYPQLKVTRTLDGVRIERPHVGNLSIDIFGFSTQEIQVEVPAGARLEIARCAGADVDGIAGGVNVHSLDGHVTLANLQGSVDAESDDGYVKATNVHGDHLAIESRDGHLTLEQIAVASLTGTTRDGRIEADDLNVTGNGTLQTDDGSVRARFTPDTNLTIDASTRDGQISVDGDSADRGDSGQRTIRLGTGAGTMKLASGDGSIHIFTHGVIQQ